MKQLFIILLICLSCNNNTSQNTNTSDTKAEYDLDSFMAKFKSISLDTLKVYSRFDQENDSFQFKGVALNHHDWPFVQDMYGEFAKEYDGSDEQLNQFYACYRIDLNKEISALIIRTPGEYSSSKIHLFLANTTLKKVTHSIQLAEDWGDAGDAFEQSSFLYKTATTLELFQYNYSSYDHSVEDEKDTTLEEWQNVYHLKIQSNAIDTIANDSANLLRYWSKK